MATTPIQKIKPLQRGEAIDQNWIAALTQTVNLLVDTMAANPGGGGGSGGTGGGGGLTIADVLVALEPDRFQAVKIADRRLSGTAIEGTYFPSGVKYRVKGIRSTGIDEDNVTPERDVKDDDVRIHPAQIGTTALLERDRDETGTRRVRLWLMHGAEKVARKRCGA